LKIAEGSAGTASTGVLIEGTAWHPVVVAAALTATAAGLCEIGRTRRATLTVVRAGLGVSEPSPLLIHTLFAYGMWSNLGSMCRS
jgi:hypothetical protein